MRCELSLSAFGLKNVAGAFKGTSDPIAVVTQLATSPGDQPKILGRTEEVEDSLNPQWMHLFRFEYELGTPLQIHVEVWDKVKKGVFKSMGSVFFDVGMVLGSVGSCRAKSLKRGGVIVARIRKGTSQGELRLKLKGCKLQNKDGFMQKSDPYYEIFKRGEDEDGFICWEKIYKSKIIMDNLNPVWPETVIDIMSICDGDLNHPIKIVVYDFDATGEHEKLGEAQVTVNMLIDSCTEGIDDIKRTIPMRLGGDHNVGKLMVLEAHVHGVSDNFEVMAGVAVKSGAPLKIDGNTKPKPNFMDFVIGGCEFNVCFAIDFTSSNGDPSRPGTLHYLNPTGRHNDYEKAIFAILNVLGRFDSDRHYAVWGFGAKYNDKVYNIFQCGEKTLVGGIDGVLKTYRDQFRSGITLAHTQTVFTDVIATATAHAKRSARLAETIGEQVYTVLIILTDGDCEDVDATAKALDAASEAPLSVVFVGIGENDFKNMRFLDDGLAARKRDIARFVCFDNFAGHSQEFTSESLQEIPRQLTDYFEWKKVEPLPEVNLKNHELMILPPEPELDVVMEFDPEDTPVLKSGGVYYLNIFEEVVEE